MKSPITTHILDTAKGSPAAGVSVVLEIREDNSSWRVLSRRTTNADGRVDDLMPPDSHPKTGMYRLRFETGKYFDGLGFPSFFPYVEVAFVVSDSARHHHVPLLISPFGYSTYRGS